MGAKACGPTRAPKGEDSEQRFLSTGPNVFSKALSTVASSTDCGPYWFIGSNSSLVLLSHRYLTLAFDCNEEWLDCWVHSSSEQNLRIYRYTAGGRTPSSPSNPKYGKEDLLRQAINACEASLIPLDLTLSRTEGSEKQVAQRYGQWVVEFSPLGLPVIILRLQSSTAAYTVLEPGGITMIGDGNIRNCVFIWGNRVPLPECLSESGSQSVRPPSRPDPPRGPHVHLTERFGSDQWAMATDNNHFLLTFPYLTVLGSMTTVEHPNHSVTLDVWVHGPADTAEDRHYRLLHVADEGHPSLNSAAMFREWLPKLAPNLVPLYKQPPTASLGTTFLLDGERCPGIWMLTLQGSGHASGAFESMRLLPNGLRVVGQDGTSQMTMTWG